MLATGKLIGIAFGNIGQLHQIKCTIDLVADVRLADFAVFQTKGNIVENRFMGEQGIVLKHKTQIALVDRQAVDPLTPDQQIALGDIGQTGNHAQCRGFATARRTQKRDETVVWYGQVNAFDGSKFAVAFDDILQFNGVFGVCHC